MSPLWSSRAHEGPQAPIAGYCGCVVSPGMASPVRHIAEATWNEPEAGLTAQDRAPRLFGSFSIGMKRVQPQREGRRQKACTRRWAGLSRCAQLILVADKGNAAPYRLEVHISATVSDGVVEFHYHGRRGTTLWHHLRR